MARNEMIAMSTFLNSDDSKTKRIKNQPETPPPPSSPPPPPPPTSEEPQTDGASRLPDDDETRDDVDNQRKDVTLEDLKKQEPRDRYRLVYVIMMIHGISLLMPWNMFITAKSYFEDYKLTARDKTRSDELREYRINFMSYLSMASQFPIVALHVVNIFCQCGGKPAVRIVGSLTAMIIVFVITLSLAMVDSSSWPREFFWITLMSAIIINSAVGVYQSSLYGVVAYLPMKYTNAVIFGNNISGTFVALLNIVVIALSPDAKSSAIYYFLTAVLVLLIAVDSYVLLPHTTFFHHFKSVMKWRQAEHKKSRPQQETFLARIWTYWQVFKQIWVLALSVWLVFVVSLALFPQIQSDIKRLSFPISDLYWTPVFCFLSFNLFAMLGNLLTERLRFPGPRWVWLPVLLRVVFVPLYLMFNFRPSHRSWAAPLANDYAFIFCSVLMAFSGGYLSSLCMMYAPVKVERHHAGYAGMMMSLFLVLGILCGVNASRLLVTFV
ncbi:hypothetical protein ACOMHN_034358 [Nucella lapillus]